MTSPALLRTVMRRTPIALNAYMYQSQVVRLNPWKIAGPGTTIGSSARSSQVGSFRFSFVTRRGGIPKDGGAGLKAKTVPTQSSASSQWNRIAWYVKIVRIPTLIGAIYTLGYQQGVVDTVRNPQKQQQGTFEMLCMQMGVTSGDDVKITSERAKDPNLTRMGRIHNLEGLFGEDVQETDPRAQKVADVGREIIRAARRYVRGKIEEETAIVKEKLKGKQIENIQEYYKLLNEEKEVKFWIDALDRIEGYSVDGIKNWQYVLINTPLPNAFVSEMLPQRFFVTTGLFEKFVDNDDELAMVLGHEISHMILGHLSKSNIVEFMFRGLEIAVLMLDPTEGMLSLGVATFLASTRDYFLATFSQGHELEADELGCKLAAMACYDTARGSKTFLKMHEEDLANGSVSNSVMSSHPPSLERYEKLQKISADENLQKYSHCDNLKRRVRRALSARREL